MADSNNANETKEKVSNLITFAISFVLTLWFAYVK